MINVRKQLKDVPHKPGVYLMKNRLDKIIYIGKARDLRKRLANHFQKTDHAGLKQALMVSKVHHFDTIITQTENEALILEAQLIRRHQPHYNVILKDDKRYPLFRIDTEHPYPSLEIVRKAAKDKALYFGPYSSAASVRETFKFINKTFKLRKCSAKQFKNRKRPCLQHQIGLCWAPCVLSVSETHYQVIVNEVVMFLKGRTPQLIRNIRKQMDEASANQAYERAIELRNRMYALERVLEKQSVVSKQEHDRDVIATATADGSWVITLMLIRNGLLMDTQHFDSRQSFDSETIGMESFVKQYYPDTINFPKEILTSIPLESPQALSDWLSGIKGRRIRVLCPRKGEKRRLVGMALENAQNRLVQLRQQHQTVEKRLSEIKNRLGLESIPKRIECFDNSTLFGAQAVSAMVVFLNGQPLKSAYRTYRLRHPGPGNDYEYMTEVIERRYKKKEGEMELPDLLLLDGGRGQLSVVQSVLKTLGFRNRIKVAAIAKPNPDRGEKEDKIYIPGRKNPVKFGSSSEGLLYLQRIRDEAHRFVISYHRRLRRKAATRSVLDRIPGVGPKRRQALLQHFLTVDRLVAANLDEICQVPGINPKIAGTILSHIKRPTKTR